MHDGGFARVRVEDHLYFTRTHFQKTANFIGASVGFLGIFEGAVFDGDALFERAEFAAGLFFRPPEAGGPVPGAIFNHVADFKGTRVNGQAEFSDVTFHHDVRMGATKFNELLFRRTRFLPCTTGENGCNDVTFDDAEYGVLDLGGDGQTASFSPERKPTFRGFSFHDLRTPLPFLLGLFARDYNRDPYNYAEKFYREKGERGTADTVYYERRRVEGGLIPVYTLSGFLDRVWRYVFGYGVKMRFPMYWISGLVVFSALVLCRRDALQATDVEAAPADGPDQRPLISRLATSLLITINLLIPKVQLPGADRWQPADRKITFRGRKLPLSYGNVATAAKVLAWSIITVSASLFSISDFVKN
jgi:hypothetical protein